MFKPALRKWTIIVAGVVIISGVACLCWPSRGWNAANLDPRLRQLHTPFKQVVVAYYLDGGSIGLRVVTKDGEQQELALPISSQANYPKLFVGGMHINDGATQEIPFDQDTRRWLISTIELHRRATEGEAYLVLCELRGWPKDYARLFLYVISRRIAGE